MVDHFRHVCKGCRGTQSIKKKRFTAHL